MTAFALKIIALSAMLIDHLGAVFPMYFPPAFRVIGRIAFPIYVYLIADGCRHTRNMLKYTLRLGVFALLSQIPFDLAFNQQIAGPLRIDFLYDTNVFYTLFLGAACVYVYKETRGYARLLSIPALFAATWLAETLHTDYGAFGVVFIALMYVIPKKIPRLAVMALCCCYSYLPVLLGLMQKYAVFPGRDYIVLARPLAVVTFASCLLSVPAAALYNGRRGPNIKWFFYAVYPAHLLLYAVIWLLFVRAGLPA